ncbi:hypothetical protein OIU76_024447 [Salix suchowensis]|nr:hypothetical protein OIU76_024447 [Salix suchowensis]
MILQFVTLTRSDLASVCVAESSEEVLIQISCHQFKICADMASLVLVGDMVIYSIDR